MGTIPIFWICSNPDRQKRRRKWEVRVGATIKNNKKRSQFQDSKTPSPVVAVAFAVRVS